MCLSVRVVFLEGRGEEGWRRVRTSCQALSNPRMPQINHTLVVITCSCIAAPRSRSLSRPHSMLCLGTREASRFGIQQWHIGDLVKVLGLELSSLKSLLELHLSLEQVLNTRGSKSSILKLPTMPTLALLPFAHQSGRSLSGSLASLTPNGALHRSRGGKKPHGKHRSHGPEGAIGLSRRSRYTV